MRTLLRTLLVSLLAPAAIAAAQEKPQGNPLSAYNKSVYGGLKAILLRSADKMPEESFSFRPTEAVRSFGQVLGHVADAQYTFCSLVLGEKNPALKVEETRSSKADLTAALKDAFTYCDRAYDGMTDTSAVQMVKLFGSDAPRLGVLTVNNLHSVEHYGNLVTYMRMKNVVPPTSDPEFQPVPKK